MRTFLIGAAGVVVVAAIAFFLIGFLSPREITVQHRRFIAAEPLPVWNAVADYRAWPSYFEHGEPGASQVSKVEVKAIDDGGVGTERTIDFTDGSEWRDMVSVYEPPYDLRFSGVNTPGVLDWQNHILLEPGARGGTVATFRVSFTPDGFLARVMTQIYYESIIRHQAIAFLNGVAGRLGVENTNVEQYVLSEAQKRAKAKADHDAAVEGGLEPTGAPAPAAQPAH